MNVSDLASVPHLHHAYLVARGSPAEITAMLKQRGIPVSANPDLLAFRFTDLSVDDSRMIAERAFLKSVGAGKYFIISFDRAGVEAQNALLKVVEEAPGNTHYFFCVASSGFLIATLRSRCVEIQTSDVQETFDVPDEAAAFLKLGYAARLETVEKLVSAAQKSQDRSEVRAFVRDVTRAMEKSRNPNALRTLLRANEQLQLSGGSPKLVLSHLAVTLPTV